MKYLVTYKVDNIFPSYDGSAENRPQGHTLTVVADSKVQAFVEAYKILASQGHMVRTMGWKARYTSIQGGVETRDYSMAGLSSDEMEEVYRAGVPQVWQDERETLAMTHIDRIQTFDFVDNIQDLEVPTNRDNVSVFVDEERLKQLASLETSHFDLSRLIQLCREANICYTKKCYLAVAMITRSIIDHVPPIFGFSTFSQVANNYSGPSSFKESMAHLDKSSRKIADAHLHTHIRRKEILPTRTQVNFSNDIDVLLAEIIRILS